jgi:hypothetical protein
MRKREYLDKIQEGFGSHRPLIRNQRHGVTR